MADPNRRRNRKDHILPASYLDGFAHPKPPEPTKPLWVFNLSLLKWERKSSTQIAHERGFYDYAPGSTPDASADDAFRRLENDFPKARAAIRRDGYSTWPQHRDVLVSYGAMLAARSRLFREQSSADILPTLEDHPDKEVLAKNYAITNMRSEIPRRAEEWKSYHWVLSYTTKPDHPVITCDQPIGMNGNGADQTQAYKQKDFWLLFPVAWDMCLVGSTTPISGDQTRVFPAEYLAELHRYIRAQASLLIVSPVQLAVPSL
jgi:hypothetical protein